MQSKEEKRDAYGCKIVSRQFIDDWMDLDITITESLKKVGSGDPGLQINTTWQISKVMSLSTLHREFGALKAMQYYDEVDTILQPKLSTSTSISQAEARRISQIYNVNEPQAIAIASSAPDNYG
ncbi:hypothetical protein EWM64_g5901 [Hericium alpestre]|uniref:Uncharacterized protein n=1 Tax=Hericium alpestre TaxID=135208 RepID=A0A4Y9ZTI6_9AGAM|nr:hypothetical protein EWM64_g5901 [Hericium alpestre]